MARSKLKSKLSTEDICRTYYETQVFGPGGVGDASQLGLFPDTRIYLELRDASFKGIDVNTFTNEIIAANIEVFGLTWLDHHREFNTDSPDNFVPVVDEIGFTKGYLSQIGRGDIWERMGAYNAALATTIADSIVSGAWGGFRDVPTDIYEEGYQEARANELSKIAEILVDDFGRHTADVECLERLMVRALFVPCDTQKFTALSQNISLVLAERLSRDPKTDGLFAIQRIIVGLHENAEHYLQAIRDYGSHEAAKSARSAFIEHMIRHVTSKKPGDSHGDLC